MYILIMVLSVFVFFDGFMWFKTPKAHRYILGWLGFIPGTGYYVFYKFITLK